MEQNLQKTVSLLACTPATLNALLRDLPEEWTFHNEGENTWNAFDVVGHLIHAERTDWMPRARMILEFGQDRTFEPFDRWAQQQAGHGKSLHRLNLCTSTPPSSIPRLDRFVTGVYRGDAISSRARASA